MNYALKEQADCWLRHPVLGDPSFDSFIHRDTPVVTSEPPYEWTVNGSLFRDPETGKWLLQAGRYHDGYAAGDGPSYCDLFLSEDDGKTFKAIGPALPPGSPFAGIEHIATSFPDTVVEYDPVSGKYYMAYDTSDPDFTWEKAHDPDSTVDGGGAVAVADRVEGPYSRLPGLSASRIRARGKTGRFDRLYATTLLRREQDWLLMVLCDSGEHFAWGYAAMTARTPDGPWSDPVIVLCPDREEYYPTPVEFHPCMVVDGRIYAHATSVAQSRNYQAVFAADLEEAHRPEAWTLVQDGSIWHSEPHEHEHYGIWGQTIHGFVHENMFHTMFASRDSRGMGAISLASRLWDQPLSDGFILSGHEGPAQTFLYGNRGEFTLQAEFEMAGRVSFVFDMQGVIGPNKNISDSVPVALNRCRGLTVGDGFWTLAEYDEQGRASILSKGYCDAIGKLTLMRRKNVLTLIVGDCVAHSVLLPGEGLVGLWCDQHSWIRVSRWEMEGDVSRYTLNWNGWEGLLGAGRRLADWQVEKDVFTTRDSCAKYNVIGDRVQVRGVKGPELSGFTVIVDGEAVAEVSQRAAQVEGEQVLTELELKPGRHGVRIVPKAGAMALTGLTVCGQGK